MQTKTVFVTGSTGYCGSRVLKLLLDKGYRVRGLSRTQEGADRLLKEHGHYHELKQLEFVVGSLTDVDLLEREARNSDGVIHCGFVHDFNNYDESVRIDRVAQAAFRKGLQGSGKVLLTVSGTLAVGDTGHTAVDDENAASELMASYDACTSSGKEFAVAHKRMLAEVDTLLANREAGYKASVLRLPAFVFGAGASYFVPMYIQNAKKDGIARYLEGPDVFSSAVHVDDVAAQFVAAFERTPGGAIYHSTSEVFSMKKLAEATAANLGVPAVPVTKEQAQEAWGPLLTWVCTTNNVTSISRAEKELGWTPQSKIGLYDDVAHGSYKQQ